MILDTRTLIFMFSLSLFTQVAALFVQYRIVSKIYHGVGFWLLGTSLSALAVLLMPLVLVDSLRFLAMMANPLLLLGQVYLYLAVVHFLEEDKSLGKIIVFYGLFFLSYFYYIFLDNDLSKRTIIINGSLALICVLTAYRLYKAKKVYVSISGKFTAFFFLFLGGFMAFRMVYTMMMPTAESYQDQGMLLNLSFIVPMITSTLWTFGFILMANQRLNIENLLEKEKMQLIFNTGPDAAMITRFKDGAFLDINEGFATLFGVSREELLGEGKNHFSIWQDLKDRQVFLEQLDKKRTCENVEFSFMRRDGSAFYGMISARKILINDVLHIVSVVRDVTERKEVEKALMESEEQYRSILNASPDNITITDLAGKILMASPAAKKMFGYAVDFEGFSHMHLLDFIVPEDQERAKKNLERMYESRLNKPNEYRAVGKDLNIFHVEVNSEFVRNQNGQPIRMVFIIRDITERKRVEKQIQELLQELEIEKSNAVKESITDSLTGIFNRRYFDLALDTEFYRLKRSGRKLSLIMFDIDHFKKFNDTYGHLAGDDCLKSIGALMESIIHRATDVVSRYGGEEFVVILPETDLRGAVILAESIQKSVLDLKIPHETSETENYVTVSLGVVSMYPNQLVSPKQLISLADEALYRAKDQGRNRYVAIDENTSYAYGNQPSILS